MVYPWLLLIGKLVAGDELLCPSNATKLQFSLTKLQFLLSLSSLSMELPKQPRQEPTLRVGCVVVFQTQLWFGAIHAAPSFSFFLVLRIFFDFLNCILKFLSFAQRVWEFEAVALRPTSPVNKHLIKIYCNVLYAVYYPVYSNKAQDVLRFTSRSRLPIHGIRQC